MRLQMYRGKWAAVWTEGGTTRRVSLRTDDRGIATRRLEDLKRQAAGEPEIIGQIMEVYLADRRVTVARPDRLEDAWKALRSTFEDLRPNQVTRELCRSYTENRRAAGRAEGTINKELAILRAGIRWSDPNTPAVFELPPPSPPRERYLTREEYRLLLDAAGAPHLKLFIVLALATGGRASAILELTWSRVDFKRELVRLATGEQRRKGRATVPMTMAAREALEEAEKAAVTPWVIEYAGGKIGSVKKAFSRAVKKAGLKNVSPHVLRHTAAVWMAEAGVPMSEIAQYLGHSDSRLTERVYARFSPSYLRNAASALEV